MQLRSMTDKEKGGDPNQGDARETDQTQKGTQSVALQTQQLIQ